jgi:hypothetical protein
MGATGKRIILRDEATTMNKFQEPSSNNRVQRAVIDKLLGRGRLVATPNQVMRARVLNELRPVADAKR